MSTYHDPRRTHTIETVGADEFYHAIAYAESEARFLGSITVIEYDRYHNELKREVFRRRPEQSDILSGSSFH